MGGLPSELLYADGLLWIAEYERSLCEKIVEWKFGMEVLKIEER